MAELTGLPLALVDEKNLRISDSDFFFELLRDRGRIVGRLDARATGPMAASRGREWEFDPGIEAIAAPYAMAALAYFGERSAWYRGSATRCCRCEAHKAWNWNRGEGKGNGYCSTSGELSRALRRNPHLRVFVASGRYDLGTPYSASDWSLAQLDVPPDVMAPRRAPLLRRRPHDVHAPGRPRKARTRSRRLAGRAVSRRGGIGSCADVPMSSRSCRAYPARADAFAAFEGRERQARSFMNPTLRGVPFAHRTALGVTMLSRTF